MNSFLPLFPQNIEPFITGLLPMMKLCLNAFLFCLFLLVAEFFIAVLEEKILAKIEMRKDLSIKHLFCKRIVLLFKLSSCPKQGQKILFVLAPMFALIFSLFFFFFLPVGKTYLLHPEYSLLYLLFASSVGMYCFITGGWASGTRFSFFGAIRMIAQSLTCQPLFALIIIIISMSAGASDLYSVVEAQKKVWFIFPHFPLFVLYMLSCLMLLSFPPFGSPKAKRELAGGIFAEYSGALYLLFLIAQNLFLILCCALGSLLFLGAGLPFLKGIDFGLSPLVLFLFKTLFLVFLFTLVKASFPNWKIDYVINKSFQIFIPFAFLWFVATACFLFLFSGGL